MTTEYIALIYKENDSSFGVSFPDFPGCISAGETLQEALKSAKEALEFHMQGMREDGDSIPSPSTLDEIRQHAEYEDAVVTLITVNPPFRVVRLNITMPDYLVKQIDHYTSSSGESRSGFLSEAAKRALEESDAHPNA